MRWLRENGRYLAPNGSGDRLLALGVILRNGVALHLVMATLGLALFLAMLAARWGLGAMLASAHFIEAGMPGRLLWWSPYLAMAGVSFGLWALPLGWAYWLTPSRGRDSRAGQQKYTIAPWLTVLVLAALGAVLAGLHFSDTIDGVTEPFAWFAAGTAVAGGLALITFAVFRWRHADQEKKINNLLSNHLRVALLFTCGVLALGVVDSLGQTCFAACRTGIFSADRLGKIYGWVTTGVGALGGVAVIAQRMLLMLGDKAGEKRAAPPVKVLAMLAAALIIGSELTAISALAHGAAWGWKLPWAVHYAADPRWYVMPVLPSPQGPGSLLDSVALSSLYTSSFNPYWIFGSLAVVMLLSYAFGGTYQFLNRSSHAPLYSARLTRAYLGATNSQRRTEWAGAVTATHPADDFELGDYRPHEAGGPLHIISTTLNETVDGRSQLEQQDRKGMGLAVGPVGVSVGIRHHAYWQEAPSRDGAPGATPRPARILRTGESLALALQGGAPSAAASEFRVFEGQTGQGWIPCEQLSLGQWIGISGAAFSTGIGARTNLGMSLLCAFFNVRLGHWWYSGVDPRQRKHGTKKKCLTTMEGRVARVLSVQWHVLDEALARFPGTARRNWYLSDGGHFENTACYELIRRRARFIVLCDNGEDPDYLFEDIAGLVRKARLDFGAEISFLSSEDLDAVLHPDVRPCFGELEHLRRGKWELGSPAGAAASSEAKSTNRWRVTPDRKGHSLSHAALARIKYGSSSAGGSEPCSFLLVIKPTLTGEESKDLLEYHSQHEAFPQEPTADQFFDEAQWESYRKLGEHVGSLLFRGGQPQDPDAGWSPCALGGKALGMLDSRLK